MRVIVIAKSMKDIVLILMHMYRFHKIAFNSSIATNKIGIKLRLLIAFYAMHFPKNPFQCYTKVGK